jgi:hypothetical protein
MTAIASELFRASPEIRYVAIYRGGEPELSERPGLRGASAAESDRYEEILVNPTLMTLARQRGDIDCGGVVFLLIRYGNFFQLVHPIRDGHVSVAIEPGGDPLDILPAVRRVITEAGLLEPAT